LVLFRLRLPVINYPQSKPLKPLYTIIQPVIFLGLIVFTSCQKEVSDFSVYHSKIDNTPKAAVIIRNNTPGFIHLTVNGVAIEGNLQSNGNDTVYGNPLAPAKIIVETVTVDINDNPAGEQLVFQYALDFPEEKKNIVQEVNVPADFFFVNVINLSNAPANRLTVSEPGIYGVINCDMTISNSPQAVACGYYPTHNLIADIKVIKNNESVTEWNFTNLQLPGVVNQAITITCN
jgi:hypothetical protein